MAVRSSHEIPLDAATQMPLTLLTDMSYAGQQVAWPEEPAADWHHQNFFANRAALQRLGNAALHYGRKVGTERRAHKIYHAQRTPPKLPEHPEEVARMLAYIIGGYIPEEAELFDARGGIERLQLPLAERHSLVYSGAVQIDQTEPLRAFFYSYLAAYGFSERERCSVVRLLNEPNNQSKRAIGDQYMKKACSRALQPFCSEFAGAWNGQLLPLAGSGDIGACVYSFVVQEPLDGMSRKEIRRLQNALEQTEEAVA